MLYAIAGILGVIVGYVLAVSLPDTAVGTATARANAKFSIPLALVLAAVIGFVAYQQATIGDLSFKLDAAMQGIEILKGGSSAPTR